MDCVNFCGLTEKHKALKKNQKVEEKRVYKVLKENFREPCEYNVRVYLVNAEDEIQKKKNLDMILELVKCILKLMKSNINLIVSLEKLIGPYSSVGNNLEDEEYIYVKHVTKNFILNRCIYSISISVRNIIRILINLN